MSRNLTIFIAAICFFLIQESKPHFHFWNRRPSVIKYLPSLPKPTGPAQRMWIAIISGERKALKKDERQLFLRLGVTHIFTPSGLHLSTLTIFLTKGRIFKIGALIFGFLMGWIGLFPAMTRVLFLKSVPRSFPYFVLTLLLEGVFFSWHSHFLSWICSWMFLGFCYYSLKSHRALWFSVGQMLLCHVFFQEWSPIGIIINLFMMILMQLIFPLLLVASLIPTFPHDIPIWILQVIYKCLTLIDHSQQNLTLFIPHLGHLFFFLSWILLRGRQRLSLALFLLFLSAPLNQQRKTSFSDSKWEGSQIVGMRCKNEWKNQRWEEKCRPPNQGTARKN